MATNISQTVTYPAFLESKTKRMLIVNRWVDSASGKTFDSINPATGKVLATVAEGDAQDINCAVAAARWAFEGTWSKFKPYECQMLFLKLADLVEEHFDEFSRLDTIEGAPINHTAASRRRALGHAALLCWNGHGHPW